jgi:hypothetical protein
VEAMNVKYYDYMYRKATQLHESQHIELLHATTSRRIYMAPTICVEA